MRGGSGCGGMPLASGWRKGVACLSGPMALCALLLPMRKVAATAAPAAPPCSAHLARTDMARPAAPQHVTVAPPPAPLLCRVARHPYTPPSNHPNSPCRVQQPGHPPRRGVGHLQAAGARPRGRVGPAPHRPPRQGQRAAAGALFAHAPGRGPGPGPADGGGGGGQAAAGGVGVGGRVTCLGPLSVHAPHRCHCVPSASMLSRKSLEPHTPHTCPALTLLLPLPPPPLLPLPPPRSSGHCGRHCLQRLAVAGAGGHGDEPNGNTGGARGTHAKPGARKDNAGHGWTGAGRGAGGRAAAQTWATHGLQGSGPGSRPLLPAPRPSPLHAHHAC